MPKRRRILMKEKKCLHRMCLDYLEKVCLYPVPENRNELLSLPPERFSHIHRKDVALVQRLGKKYLSL